MNNKKIVGLMGFKGSGKDTVANILSEYDYSILSYAETLKQCLCVIFGWDMDMINGHTPESRKWRDEVDHWWAEKLGIPNFTPRLAMTKIGTDLFRKHFDENIWVYSLINKINNIKGNVVVTDIRFPNEHRYIEKFDNSSIYRVRRFTPEWENIGVKAAYGDQYAIAQLESMEVHESEWAWLSCNYESEIENMGSFSDLAINVEKTIINR